MHEKDDPKVTPVAEDEVPSYTTPGISYVIQLWPSGFATCTCPHYVYRKESNLGECKHLRDGGQGLVSAATVKGWTGKYRNIELEEYTDFAAPLPPDAHLGRSLL